MVALSVASAGTPALPARPCATMALLPTATPLRRGPVLAAGPDKADRDPFSLPNARTSDNFVVRWGDANGVSVSEADRLLGYFEQAWRVEVGEMGHEPPYGSDAYRFNVYVSDTGDGAPRAYGAGGYYWTDEDGWPMVVIARGSFEDEAYLEQTAAHEFYHAIQGQTGRFAYDGPSAWFWEATAEWAAVETVPENPSNGLFVAGYLWLSELPVNFFDYPDERTLQEYHQYGAFLFPHDLTNHYGRALVSGTWTDPGREPDPLEVIRARLDDEGVDFAAFWLDHAARNATLDYEIGPYLRQHLEDFAFSYPGESETFRHVPSWGDAGKAAGDQALHRFGYHRYDVQPPDAGDLHVVLEGRDAGTLGSPARYGARLVEVRETPVVHEVPFDGPRGEITLPAGSWGSAPLRLVVGAWTDGNTHWDDERFPYEYTIEAVEPPEPEAPDRRPGRRVARACDVGGGGAGIWAAAVAGLVAARRRARKVDGEGE